MVVDGLVGGVHGLSGGFDGGYEDGGGGLEKEKKKGKEIVGNVWWDWSDFM